MPTAWPVLQGRVLSNSSWDYDFRESSSRFRQAVGKTVPRSDFANSSDYEGGFEGAGDLGFNIEDLKFKVGWLSEVAGMCLLLVLVVQKV